MGVQCIDLLRGSAGRIEDDGFDVETVSGLDQHAAELCAVQSRSAANIASLLLSKGRERERERGVVAIPTVQVKVPYLTASQDSNRTVVHLGGRTRTFFFFIFFLYTFFVSLWLSNRWA